MIPTDENTAEVVDATSMLNAAGDQTTAIEAPTVVASTAPEQDIAKMKEAVESLKSAGEALFQDEITALETKIKAAEEELATKVENAVTEVEQTVIEKYGAKAVKAFEIVLLLAIVYKLFK